MSAASTPVWVVPGKQWADQISACRRVIIEKINSSTPLLISDLFKILPLNPTDQQTIDDMVARGELIFQGGEIVNSSNDVTRASFLDDNVGSVRLIIPKIVKATATTDGTKVELRENATEILLILGDLPSQYPFSGNFILRKLSLLEHETIYTLQDQISPNGWFEIKVDLRVTPTPFTALAALRSMPAHRRRKFSLAMKALADEEDSCFGKNDGSPSWYITRATFGVCRLQHGNEHVLGVVLYGPDTLENCRRKLEEFQRDGTCP